MATIPTLTDEADWTDELLDELRRAVRTEQERRYALRTAPQQAEDLADRYQKAIGRTDGDEWTQPTGAHDAYRKDAVVTHNGKTWESTTPTNVWEPGVSGWREVVAEGAAPAAWVQPTGGHDAYKKGGKVTYKGAVYESLIDANVWAPDAYPQGWKKLAA